MKRKKRSCCIYSRGVNYYHFDFEKEFAVYKYLCGEKVTNKQWKYINDNNSFEFYGQWETYVRQKYQEYDVNKLSEFRKYLQHRKRKMELHNNYWNVTFSALMGCFLAGGVNGMLNGIFILEEQMQDIMSLKVNLLFLFVVCAVVSVAVFFLIMLYLDKIFAASLKRYFFEDYDHIIKNIIAEKE